MIIRKTRFRPYRQQQQQEVEETTREGTCRTTLIAIAILLTLSILYFAIDSYSTDLDSHYKSLGAVEINIIEKPTEPPSDIIKEEELKELDQEEEETIEEGKVSCKTLSNWVLCMKHPHCIWKRSPNLEFCEDDTEPTLDLSTLPEDLKHDTKYDFHQTGSKTKYFLYQPSGGWNNQRILLENALIICKLLNRTCIAPPAAPHSNYVANYNIIPEHAIIPMTRVLNFEKINQVVPLVTIPQGITFSHFVDTKLRPHFRISTFIRDVSKYKPGTLKKMAEKDIVRLFKDETADILYFANQTMWGTIEWRGSLYGWHERKYVHHAVMPANHMKRIAYQLATNLEPYHSVHIRRGDKVMESSFSRVSHSPSWWSSRIASVANQTRKVYIATDETDRNYFKPFEQEDGLEVYFFETLPGYREILEPYLNLFPKRMKMDILGSGYSTFTTYILRLRKYRIYIAADTSKPGVMGLPESIRELKSSCDPIKALKHDKPC